ncbi:hypothetical protein NM208_g2017 [Fusarium decemcellulare]|uniref:Uncharacterized protein n=1 Tax=Fusarium decemcellulare TaxID=57161 RepID=A0ACC1SUF3_9HYPO|nr:hypothetical protein NM208_g2017 [Fusarium decemcellulare]
MVSNAKASQSYAYTTTRSYDLDLQAEDSDKPEKVIDYTEHKRYGILTGAGWLLEILTTFLSLGVLVAISIIFWSMDDKPYSNWQFPISINAVVSILATAGSAARMHGVSTFISQLKWVHFKKKPQKLQNFQNFDEASRGSYGALLFLFKVKWNLATVGALITVCQLAFGPLAQQVIDIQPRIVSTPDNAATYGYTHEYIRDPVWQFSNIVPRGVPQDPRMQSAILQGLLDIRSPQVFDCPGVCTWNDSYVSLGFKSSCKNVTAATLDTDVCDNDGGHLTCNMTTPGGIILTTHHGDTAYQTTFRLNGTSARDEQLRDESLQDLPELIKIAVYRSTLNEVFNATDVNVTECSLSLAAYRYSDASANGTEFSFQHADEIDLPRNYWSLQGDHYSALYRTNASKEEDLPGFTVRRLDLKNIQFFMTSDALVSEWVDGELGNMNYGVSAALMGDVDLPKRFAKMATSMTDYLRNGPNHKLAAGKRVESVTFVSIRWFWLIGPCIIEASALLFTLSTIVSSRRSRQVPLWKSSALAVLACWHDKDSEKIRSEFENLKGLDRAATRLNAQLE